MAMPLWNGLAAVMNQLTKNTLKNTTHKLMDSAGVPNWHELQIIVSVPLPCLKCHKCILLGLLSPADFVRFMSFYRYMVNCRLYIFNLHLSFIESLIFHLRVNETECGV